MGARSRKLTPRPGPDLVQIAGLLARATSPAFVRILCRSGAGHPRTRHGYGLSETPELLNTFL